MVALALALLAAGLAGALIHHAAEESFPDIILHVVCRNKTATRVPRKSASISGEWLCRYCASCIRGKGGYSRLQATSFVVPADPAQLTD